ncbi:YqgE/AlgH family protein [Niabella beijingensis]|uniref:YqgE/AlgH family protein n=1 Tax=Niabella beijingensis TaxID=2872700 RepID=UPI001CBB43D4|nr:YqgE/AlgH family protein [Niabella beijingensis]MBZ4189725.1 YqgE/AlgH family protein [Niabella beijingensis]
MTLLSPGMLLVSTAIMDDPYFKQTVVLITEYNDSGAMGFVLNRRFPRVFNELVEFRSYPPLPLYEGGPVDQEHLFFIHRCPDQISGGTVVSGTLSAGGDFKQALSYMSRAGRAEQEVRLFIGYCGWDKDELETEISAGYWLVMPVPGNTFIFSDPEHIWKALHN